MGDVVVLPFHQDERLGEASLPLPGDLEPVSVEPVLPEADRWQRLVALYDAHADVVAAQASRGPVRVVTGDCLATLGTLVGLQRAGLDPSLVWFDAHGDVHTLESSESGYLGGLALRMVLGGDATRLGEPLGLRPLPQERAVLVDARDLDPAEESWLADSRVTRTAVGSVSPADLPGGPVLLHVDVDVIDAAELPGLRFPAPGGPTRDQVAAALGRLVDGGSVVGVDVACPWLDPADDATVERRAGVLAALLAVAPG